MDFFQSTYVPLMGFTAIFLQFGMTLLHAAYARDKTFKSVMTKNMIGLFVSVLIWWFWGFGFATGQTKNNLSPASSTFNGISGWFLLGLVYCIYCASIVCSAVGDRMAAWAYWALVIVIAGAAFPLIFNWIWTANVDEFNGSGWLLKEGAVDYAGSGIVNLVGAVAAVTSVAVLGPREGRFITENGMRKVQTFLPYNAVAGTTGTLVHVFAWMAYLAAAAAIPAFGGRGNAYNSATAAQIASRSVTMAVIAVAAGCFVSTLGLCHLKGKVTYSLPLINETVVGSLVAISAGAPLVEGYGAFFIGVVSGLIALFGPNCTVLHGWDDVRHIHSVYGQQAVWGLISIGFWAKQDLIVQYTSRNSADYGVFFGGCGRLLGYQILVVIVIVIVVTIITMFTLTVTQLFGLHVLKNKNGIRSNGSEDMTAEPPLMVANHESDYSSSIVKN